MRAPLLLTFFLWLPAALAAPEPSPSALPPSLQWTTQAIRLTGESEAARKEAIWKLATTPNLEAYLRAELSGPHRFLAYDVISALELRKLFDDLLRASETDDSGFSYNSLNSIATPSTRAKLADTYHARVLAGRTSLTARMILLDSLARLREELSLSEIKTLLGDSSPEIRGATLSYLKTFFLKKKTKETPALLKKIEEMTQDGPFQVRIQAISLLADVGYPVSEILRKCQFEKITELQTFCRMRLRHK